jgi:hypothetical protein
MSRWRSSLCSIAATLLALAAGPACVAEERDPADVPGGSAGPGPSGPSGAGGEDGGGDGGSGGEGGGIPICSAWDGPFGIETDQLLDPNLVWEGFLPGETSAAEVALEDVAACGGEDEIRAIVIYIDALWCAVCRDVAGDLAERYDSEWKGRGVAVISLVVEDQDANPATLESAWQWRDTFDLHDMPVAADPDYQLQNLYPDSLPQTLVVDPRTMRIVDRSIGKVNIDSILDEMIADNE